MSFIVQTLLLLLQKINVIYKKKRNMFFSNVQYLNPTIAFYILSVFAIPHFY